MLPEHPIERLRTLYELARKLSVWCERIMNEDHTGRCLLRKFLLQIKEPLKMTSGAWQSVTTCHNIWSEDCPSSSKTG